MNIRNDPLTLQLLNEVISSQGKTATRFAGETVILIGAESRPGLAVLAHAEFGVITLPLSVLHAETPAEKLQIMLPALARAAEALSILSEACCASDLGPLAREAETIAVTLSQRYQALAIPQKETKLKQPLDGLEGIE
jgi:hypothetical protein